MNHETRKQDIDEAMAGVAEAANRLSECATYRVGPLETCDLPTDRADRRFAQLRAMLYMLARGTEHFGEANDRIATAYVDAMGDLVSSLQCDVQVERMRRKARAVAS